jgi:single-stranded-DNA-specific exonuclease
MQINLINPSNDSLSAQGIFDLILKSRGYESDSDQADFLNPQTPTLKNLLANTGLKTSILKKIQTILDSHIASGHDICVFGDYDADGITATAILWQALISYVAGKTVRVLPFIPDRHRHGYGLSVKAVEEMLGGEGWKTTHFPDFNPSLIITVDNGIVANQAADLLKDKGVELIITDHHQPSDTLPHASAILHSTATSGAGIAWILTLYLLNESPFALSLIDLATIGIVADMMPLHGLNRGIVVAGLKALSLTKRAGLLSLYNAAAIDPKSISTYTISFGLAPRINAAGRLYDPYDALRLLCATKPSYADPLAEKINSHNQDRQELTEAALSSLATEKFPHKIVVITGDYHEGIIGLIAGKITELTHKPSIVISNHGDTLKASARSVPGVNITELLRSLQVPFLSLGGHSQAAGFGLETSRQDEFLSELYELGDRVIPDELLEGALKVDFEIIPEQVTLELAKLIATLEPFGMGNPKPKFLLRSVEVLEDRQLGTTGKHRKLMIASGPQTLEVLLFNTKEPYPLKKLSLLTATIDINVWNSHERVQLIGSYVET